MISRRALDCLQVGETLEKGETMCFFQDRDSKMSILPPIKALTTPILLSFWLRSGALSSLSTWMFDTNLGWKHCPEKSRNWEGNGGREMGTMEEKRKNTFLLDSCFVDALGEDRNSLGDFDHSLHVMGSCEWEGNLEGLQTVSSIRGFLKGRKRKWENTWKGDIMDKLLFLFNEEKTLESLCVYW